MRSAQEDTTQPRMSRRGFVRVLIPCEFQVLVFGDFMPIQFRIRQATGRIRQTACPSIQNLPKPIGSTSRLGLQANHQLLTIDHSVLEMVVVI